MTEPLMPKATAVWLVENTALTFDQIAEFCDLHRLEVQGIADDEVAVGIRGLDPVASGQLTREGIEECEKDPTKRLAMLVPAAKVPQRARRARYTPVSKRQDRPNAISWLIKNYPELSDAQVGKLLGTTKATITAVRERTHWNTQNITPQDPILLGICTEAELLEAVRKASDRLERAAEREARAKAQAARAAATAAEAEPTETEPTQAEPTEAEPTETEPTQAQPTQAQPTEAEPTQAEPTETEPDTKSEDVSADPAPDSTQADEPAPQTPPEADRKTEVGVD